MCSDMTIQRPVSTNVDWHYATITSEQREAQNGHRGVIVWFAGLSGSGKSTLAHAAEDVLHERCCCFFVMDGGNLRQDRGLWRGLGFSV